MNRLNLMTVVPALLGAWLAGPMAVAEAGKKESFKKCQDASGHWHYGDTAAQACSDQSVITEINERGLKVDELKALPTKAERAVRESEKKQAEEQKQQQAARRKADQALLNVYETEDGIIRSRDERLVAVDGLVKLNDEFLKRLRKTLAAEEHKGEPKNKKTLEEYQQGLASLQDQIADFEAANAQKVKDRERIELKYNDILARYRTARDRAPKTAEEATGQTATSGK